MPSLSLQSWTVGGFNDPGRQSWVLVERKNEECADQHFHSAQKLVNLNKELRKKSVVAKVSNRNIG